MTPHGEQWKKMRRVLTSEILAPSMEQKMHHVRKEEYDHLVRYITTWHVQTTLWTFAILPDISVVT